MHGLDAGADDLGDVGGVGQHQRDRARARPPGCGCRESQGRDAEADQVEHDDERHPAEQVGVAGRQRSQREEHRAAEGADGGDHERRRPATHDRGDQQHAEVEQEPLRDARGARRAAIPGSKNVCCTTGQPGVLVIAIQSTTANTTVLATPIRIGADALLTAEGPAPELERAGNRAVRGHAVTRKPSAATAGRARPGVCRATRRRSPASVPFSRRASTAAVTSAVSGLSFASTRPNSSPLLPSACGQLADDHAAGRARHR